MEVDVRTQPHARLDTPAVVRDRPMERSLEPSRLGDHLDRLYRAAWALSGSREDAEDLVQETYTRVLGRPRLLRNEDDFGYLLRALRIREGTVMSRLYRARQQVVRRIEGGSA